MGSASTRGGSGAAAGPGSPAPPTAGVTTKRWDMVASGPRVPRRLRDACRACAAAGGAGGSAGGQPVSPAFSAKCSNLLGPAAASMEQAFCPPVSTGCPRNLKTLELHRSRWPHDLSLEEQATAATSLWPMWAEVTSPNLGAPRRVPLGALRGSACRVGGGWDPPGEARGASGHRYPPAREKDVKPLISSKC